VAFTSKIALLDSKERYIERTNEDGWTYVLWGFMATWLIQLKFKLNRSLRQHRKSTLIT
jgi:hypothetical protein